MHSYQQTAQQGYFRGKMQTANLGSQAGLWSLPRELTVWQSFSQQYDASSPDSGAVGYSNMCSWFISDRMLWSLLAHHSELLCPFTFKSRLFRNRWVNTCTIEFCLFVCFIPVTGDFVATTIQVQDPCSSLDWQIIYRKLKPLKVKTLVFRSGYQEGNGCFAPY